MRSLPDGGRRLARGALVVSLAIAATLLPGCSDPDDQRAVRTAPVQRGDVETPGDLVRSR